MGPEVLLALLGPAAGGAVGISTFLLRRSMAKTDAQLEDISKSVSLVSTQLNGLQIKIAESYVTKDDLLRHISMEAKWQDEVMKQLHEMRDDLRRS